MLVQNNFSFPWDEVIICPVPKVFASKELRDLGTEPKIGHVTDYVYIESGPMKFWLQKIEGKFPNYKNIIPETETFSKLTIDPKDAKFVIDRIMNLPGVDDKPIFFGVGSEGVYVRGYDELHSTATELRLGYSTSTGIDVKCSTNRLFLKEVLQFGCLDLLLKEDEPMVGRRDGSTFVWMSLEGNEPAIDSNDVSVCNSVSAAPVKNSRTSATISPANVNNVEVVGTNAMDAALTSTTPEQVPVTKPKVERRRSVKTTPAKPGTMTAMLEKAIEVREGMEAALRSQNELIREIRTSKSIARKREMKLKATVAELKNFQTA
jgi:hypothetical protein